MLRLNSLNFEKKVVNFREKSRDKMLRINSLNYESSVWHDRLGSSPAFAKFTFLPFLITYHIRKEEINCLTSV